MKPKAINVLIGLVLAVCWINTARAQQLPLEKFTARLAAPIRITDATMDCAGPYSHSHSADMKQKPSIVGTGQTVNQPTNRQKPTKKIVRPNAKANAPLRAGKDYKMATISKADADTITYTWTDANGSHISKATDVANKPEQMYELLRKVYTDKRFPGPYYSAFSKDDERERKVYYGAIDGGWNITGPTIDNPMAQAYVQVPNYDDIVINTNSTWTLNNSVSNARISSIKVLSGNTTITSWDYATNGNSLGQWSMTGTWNVSNGNIYTSSSDNKITIPGNLLKGYNNVTVEIVAFDYNSSSWGSRYVYVNGTASSQSLTSDAQTFSWNISPSSYTSEIQTVDPYNTIGDIKITASSNYVWFRSIVVYDENNNVLTSWTYNDAYGSAEYNGQTYYYYYINNWGIDRNVEAMYQTSYSNGYGTYYYGFLGSTEPSSIIIPYYLLSGHSRVRLAITAINASDGSQTLTVNHFDPKEVTLQSLAGTTYEWTIEPQAYAHTEYDPEYYLPKEEGYTALIVAVKNEATGDMIDYYNNHTDNSYLDTKEEIITYLTNNVDSIKLLTDGMRVGDASDYSIGTLYNCEGTYNKFFFLGKGQARQKPEVIRYREDYIENMLGEYIPFRFMFEQFSPTSGATGSETTDFYSKMMEGNVYNVVHDCRSVITLGHQFSMSGNQGTQSYAMTGMNFFIPDYRLKYWEDSVTLGSTQYTIDGRIQNAYQPVSDDGNPMLNPSQLFRYPVNHASWYTVYNQMYPPKVGLYKITLDATATAVAQVYEPGNRNYQVTLTWVSSLNQMTGHDVPQTYTVWYWDPKTGEQKYVVAEGITDGKTGLTTVTYLVEQEEHSYTIDYIVEGSPDDTEHSQFVATSNIDGVIIPGWNDFVGLTLDHHESDFVISENSRDNWYRNFLAIINEDTYNGLTVSKISGADGNQPMKSFNLYRYEYKNGVASGAEEKVATLTFDQVSADQVHYTVKYDQQDMTKQQILDYTINAGKDNEVQSAYQRDVMGIPDQGWVRVKGNGDLVIWPNGYHVNFKSITVKNNGSTLSDYCWDHSQSTLPSTMALSPGSKWEEHTISSTGDQVGYMEGGGYLYIPGLLNQYDNLSVEIVAYGEVGSVPKITVNDKTQSLTNTAANYTWSSLSPNAMRAPKRADADGTLVWDFEQESDFTDWKNYDVDGDGYKWKWDYDETDPFTTHSGYGILLSESYHQTSSSGTALTPNNWLVSPEVTLGGKLSLWACSQDSRNPEVFGVYVCNATSYSTTGDFVQLGSDITTTGTMTEYTFDLSQFEGQGYIAIVHHNVTDQFILNIDDISITGQSSDEPAVEGGLLRMHLLMVDQLKANIPDDNSHAEAYGYVLRYEPNGPDGDGKKQSGTVKVDIEKTDAKPNGYYTVNQINNDQNIDTALLQMNVLDAQVQMNLNAENPNVLYFQMQGAEKNKIPDTYLTQLQYMKNIHKYEEMLKGSAHEGKQYDTDKIHYYFNDAEPEVGSYTAQDWKAYAPSVSTWGIDRRYFESDGQNNTYGAPVWKTAVGDVSVGDCVAQMQVGANSNKPSASTSWTAEGKNYCLYFLSAIAQGSLPNPELTKIGYEPYMFRVFIESANGNLRKFVQSEDGTHLEDGGPITGKYCVGSFDINSGTWNADQLLFNKGISNDRPTETNPGWDGNMKFGAAVDLPNNDLKVYVRFYYMVKGWTPDGMSLRASDGESDARPGNGAEGGNNPGISTAVYEVNYQSEIVEQTFFNPQGMQSSKPFDGINIVITRYSDGTTSTTKVVH